MPIYEYRCRCGYRTDDYRSVADRDDVPTHCGPMARIISPVRVSADIQPYWTVAADKRTGQQQYIQSRRQHREFLKRNGYEEIGSESIMPKSVQERFHAEHEAARDPSRKHDNSIDVLAA